ncbi:hypothetical protein K439DRAFT_1352155, partial [Ramaria rubella]
WVGYDAESKASRVYWPDKGTVSVECNVGFDKDLVQVPGSVPLKGEWVEIDCPTPSTPNKTTEHKDKPMSQNDNSIPHIPSPTTTALPTPTSDPLYDSLCSINRVRIILVALQAFSKNCIFLVPNSHSSFHLFSAG